MNQIILQIDIRIILLLFCTTFFGQNNEALLTKLLDTKFFEAPKNI